MVGDDTSLTGIIYQEKNDTTGYADGDVLLKDVVVLVSTPEGNLVATIRTDENGYYAFTGLWSGEYVVSYVPVDGLDSLESFA